MPCFRNRTLRPQLEAWSISNMLPQFILLPEELAEQTENSISWNLQCQCREFYQIEQTLLLSTFISHLVSARSLVCQNLGTYQRSNPQLTPHPSSNITLRLLDQYFLQASELFVRQLIFRGDLADSTTATFCYAWLRFDVAGEKTVIFLSNSSLSLLASFRTGSWMA